MRLKFWIGIAVSVGLLAYIISRIDFARLWETVKSVDPYYLAAAVVLNLAFFIIRAKRWQYLLAPVKPKIPLMSLFSATIIGFMANNVLPARLGEIVRAYVIGRREDIPKSSAFATIVVERLFDTLSVLFLLIIVLLYLPDWLSRGSMGGAIRKAGYISLGVYVIGVAFLVYLVRHPETLPRILRRITGLVSEKYAARAARAAEKFIKGLEVAKQPRLLFFILFYSALHWGLLWVPIFLLFKAFGLPYGPYISNYFLVVTCFSVAVPSTPGFIGTYEAAAVGSLVILGLSMNEALGFALVSHAVNYISVTLLGFFFLYRENLSLGRIKEVEVSAS
ncbi:MAG: lysylphosphatidylglycerol synthase transmembrane domain-containing protein [Nitrospirota bacterium]